MPPMQRIRAYHAALAVLTLLAWLSGDFGFVHAWLGYAVAAIIGVRLLWALVDPRQLGLNRFYPQFDRLRIDNALRHPAISRVLILGIALALLAATASGVLLDGGRTIGIPMKVAGPPSGGLHEFLEELHESVSNLLILFVVLHAGYLIAFKRPLARFMLFRTEKRRPG